MADIRRNMTVNVEDGGTIKNTTKSIKELSTGLDEVTASAKTAQKQLKQVDKAGAGGTAASRKAAESAQSAFKEQHQQFDRARGTAQASGAAARDFANQSRGLGGLVRLYATFAANLFALGAAFRALSATMDTSNMVKGLDQLGAAVGRNLGGLSKELVEISGGAISLAEAMKAVAQTSTGGLSGENIKRLGGVARTASAALGVAMPDAVNRLSRAITKLEPELLDELGIMTRLEPAVDIYARQLGKASSQLTQFERRQAFANAVLAEGEEKFGAIEDIPINAFDVLSSSLKDLTQIAGTFLNTGLVPIIQLLSTSPVALGAGMAALVGIIAKQAIPVFLDLNKQFALSAEKAAEVANDKVEAAARTNEVLKKLDIERLEQVKLAADKEQQIQDTAVARIRKANAKAAPANLPPEAVAGRARRLDKIEAISLKDVTELRRKDIAAIQRQADARIKAGGAAAIEGRHLDNLAKSLAREKDAAEANAAINTKNDLARQNNTVTLAANRAALEANFVAQRRQIIAETAANASVVGRTAAMQIADAETKKLNASMAAANVTSGKFTIAMFNARVAVASFATAIAAVNTVINKLFSALAALAIISVIFSFVKSALSDNTKEVEKFRSAIDDAESASENMVRTLKLMSDKGLKGSIEGINATANAFDGLATSMGAVIEASREAQENASFFDNLTDGFLSFVGFGGIEDDLDEALVSLTLGAIKGLDETGLKEVGEAKFREILGITGLDSELNEKTVTEAIGSLGKEGQDALKENLKEVGHELSNASSRMESFKTSTEAANLAFAQLIQSTSSNDPIFRLGLTMQGLASSMIKVATSGTLVTEQINAVVLNLSQNADSTILFGPKTVENILEVKNQVLALSEARKEIIRIDKELSTAKPGALSEKSTELKKITKDGIEIVLSDQFLTVFEQLSNQRAAAVEITKTQEEVTAKSAKVFNLALTESFERGSKLIAQATGNAQEKAALAIRKANLGGLSGEQLAKEQLAITKREIEIQIEAVNTNISLITSQEALRATIEANTAASSKATAIRSGASPEEVKGLTEAQAAAEIFKSAFNQTGGFTIAGFDKLVDSIEDTNVKLLVQARGITPKSQIAGQDATKAVLGANLTAAEIGGERNIAKGRLEDTIRLTQAQAASIQLQKEALELEIEIAGTKSVAAVKEQGRLDLQLLEIKHSNEIATSQLAINNAAVASERIKQQELADQQLISQEIEKSNLLTQVSINNAKALVAEFALNRDIRIAEATQIQQQELGILDIEKARNDAAATRFGLTDSISASMREQTDLAALALQTSQAEAIEQGKIAATRIEAEAVIAELDSKGGDSGAARAQLDREERASKARLLTITTTAAQEREIIKIRAEATRELDRQNRLLKTSDKLAGDLGKTFGKVGKGIGTLVSNFSKFLVNFEKGQGTITALLKERSELNAQDIKDKDAILKNEKDIQLARSESVINQLEGFSALAGAGKSFFDEQSKGYEILSGIEKAFAALSIALTVARVVADTSATVTGAANSSTRIGFKVAEAEVDGIAAVVKTLSSLPFPANLAAGAAIAAVVAALLVSIGGKGPKISSSGFKAEDVQEVQGTGTQFVNGKKVSRFGGALGADEDKVDDIARSLELIQSSTSLTSKFGSESISLLSLIEQNTRSLTAALIGTTSIGKKGSSAFGSIEGSSFKVDAFQDKIRGIADPLGKMVPVLGGIIKGITGFVASLFGTKTKIKIIDKGVLAAGNLAEILAGTDTFKEFETLEITKKKKFFGLSTSKKKEIEENTKDLETSTGESFVKLFSNLIDVSILASKEAFGDANTAIQKELETFQIDFKVSGFELSGEEFSEAILAESNVIINQLIGQALPALELFRELGEGFAGTLLRVATTMSVAREKLDRLGLSLTDLAGTAPTVSSSSIAEESRLRDVLSEAISAAVSGGATDEEINAITIAEQELANTRLNISAQMGEFTKPLVESLNQAQSAFIAAKLSVSDNKRATEELATVEKLLNNELTISASKRTNAKAGITEDVITLFNATVELERSFKAAASAVNNQGLLLLNFSQEFVAAFGGLESFIDKTDFFFENFFSEEEQLIARTNEVNAALANLRDEGFLTTAELNTLTDGSGNLRAEYREITLATAAIGVRGAEAAAALFTLAPAIDAIAGDFEDATDDIKSIMASIGDDLKEGFRSILEDAVTGNLEDKDISGRVSSLINDTFALALSNSLINDISSLLVDQLLTPILNGALTSTVVASLSIGVVVDDLLAKADALATILNNPQIRQALATVAIVAKKVIKDINDSVSGLSFVFSELRLDELTEQIADLNEQIAERTLQELIDLEDQRLITLREQADALETSTDRFKEFSRSLDDFRRSLLVSELSPLTPEEKLNTAETNFKRLLELAKDDSNPEEQVQALERIQEAASDFLDTARVFFSSSPQFTAIFDFVQDELSALSSLTGAKASVDQLQLDALNVQIEAAEAARELLEEQRNALNNIDNNIEALTKKLLETEELLAMEMKKANNEIVAGFTSLLDTDFSGGVSLEELLASNLASDSILREIFETLNTNSDSEISALEAISKATENTAFGINDVINVLAAVNAGEITATQGQTQINALQAANASVGASTDIGNITTNGAFSILDGQIVNTTGGSEGTATGGVATLLNGVITGADGSTISLADAKTFLTNAAQEIEAGTLSAKSVYNTLVDFGASAQLVADVLGNPITAEDVNNFFQAYDQTLPSFARGIDLVPEDMLAKIHEGERILPKADNTELMAAISNKRDANDQLVVEFKNLGDKIEKVEKAITENAVTKEVAEILSKMMEGNLANAQAIVEATIQAAGEGAAVVSESNADLAAQEEWRKRSVVEIR